MGAPARSDLGQADTLDHQAAEGTNPRLIALGVLAVYKRYIINVVYYSTMETEVLFGSRVRADTLETLASTSKPLTAYRVARVTGAQPIQVLSILKSLQPDLVRRDSQGWVLVSDSLRRFLRDEMVRREAERRAEKDELLARLRLAPRQRHGRH